MSSINLKVISFNVSGAGDLRNTAVKFESSTNQKVSTQAQAILTPGANVDEIYGSQMESYFTKLIELEQPDVLCLQELPRLSNLNKFEHAKLETVLKNHEYTLCLKQDTAIAYKTEKFDLVNEGSTVGSQSSAYFADLKEKESGDVLRFVSDHPEYSDTGAATLKNNVEFVDNFPVVSPFERLWKKIVALFQKRSPNSIPNEDPISIIYGMDGNATRKIPGEAEKPEEIRTEWQPERLDIFSERKFVTDLSNNNPTLAFKAPQKIDHIFAKAIMPQTITMKHKVVAELNDPDMLTSPEILPASDHLPVIYEITVTPQESFKSLISACFRSIFKK